MNRRVLAVAAIALLSVAVGSYYVFWVAPHACISAIRDASIRGDTASLETLVDFPRLRESIREHVVREAAARATPEGVFERLVVATFVSVGTDVLVEAAVSPRGLVALLRGKQAWDVQANPGEEIDSNSLPEMAVDADLRSLREVVLTIPTAGGKSCIGLVLVRHGVDWRLSGVDGTCEVGT